MMARPRKISIRDLTGSGEYTYVHGEANTICDYISIAFDERSMKKCTDDKNEATFRVGIKRDDVAIFLSRWELRCQS